MKKFIENILFVAGAILTLGLVVVAGVCAKNLGEFLEREDL